MALVLGDDILHAEAGYTAMSRLRNLDAVATEGEGDPLVAVRRALARSTAKTMAQRSLEVVVTRPRPVNAEAAHADLSDRGIPHLSPEVVAPHQPVPQPPRSEIAASATTVGITPPGGDPSLPSRPLSVTTARYGDQR